MTSTWKPGAVVTPDDTTLLERSSGGITVRLQYLSSVDVVGVHVRIGDGDAGQFKSCSKSEALEVYHHPFAYGFRFPQPQTNEFEDE